MQWLAQQKFKKAKGDGIVASFSSYLSKCTFNVFIRGSCSSALPCLLGSLMDLFLGLFSSLSIPYLWVSIKSHGFQYQLCADDPAVPFYSQTLSCHPISQIQLLVWHFHLDHPYLPRTQYGKIESSHWNLPFPGCSTFLSIISLSALYASRELGRRYQLPPPPTPCANLPSLGSPPSCFHIVHVQLKIMKCINR